MAVVKGLVEGALDAEGITIIECATDVTHASEDAYAAIKDLKKGGVVNDVHGIVAIGKALYAAHGALKECHLIKDLEKLEKIAKIMSSPAHFAAHTGLDIIVNGVSIWSELKEAKADFEGKKWEPFGHDLGYAAALVFAGKAS